MKHIFIVHSHITYLVSLATILYKKLKFDDVFIITFSERFNPEDQPVELIRFDLTHKRRIGKVISSLINLNYSKNVDIRLAKLLKSDEYSLYINYAHGINRILMTNPNCKQLNFIEEGMDSYKSDTLENYTIHAHDSSYRPNFSERFIDGLRFFKGALEGKVTKKMVLLPVHPSCFSLVDDVSFFCFSKFAFPRVLKDKKHVLDIISTKPLFKPNDSKLPDNSVIWIGDNVVNFYNMPVDYYIEAIKRGVLEFYEKGRLTSIFVKFHGSEDEESKNRTKELFCSMGITTKIIGNEHSVELMLLNSSNCVLLGLSSSLLWYANLIGHKSYSVSKHLPMHNHIPNDHVFWEKVNRL